MTSSPDSSDLDVVPTDHQQTGEAYTLYSVNGKTRPIVVTVNINSKPLQMEVDTGASLSIICEETFNKEFNQTELKPTDIILQTYSGEPLTILGMMDAKIVYNDQSFILPLIVVKGHGPSLFGRSWLKRIKLNWPSIYVVTDKLSLNKVLDKHLRLFREDLGLLQGSTAKIFVSQEAQPRFHKAQPVPYYLKAKVEQELQWLVKQESSRQ